VPHFFLQHVLYFTDGLLFTATSKKSYEAGFDTSEAGKRKKVPGDDKVRSPFYRRNAYADTFS